uniref:Uncharacterized protein n=1 Tax=Arundo donax TaxID=35708 RepID=A0A0A8ZW26_ARUDO
MLSLPCSHISSTFSCT